MGSHEADVGLTMRSWLTCLRLLCRREIYVCTMWLVHLTWWTLSAATNKRWGEGEFKVIHILFSQIEMKKITKISSRNNHEVCVSQNTGGCDKSVMLPTEQKKTSPQLLHPIRSLLHIDDDLVTGRHILIKTEKYVTAWKNLAEFTVPSIKLFLDMNR